MTFGFWMGEEQATADPYGMTNKRTCNGNGGIQIPAGWICEPMRQRQDMSTALRMPGFGGRERQPQIPAG
jgi:hypothetical protein